MLFENAPLNLSPDLTKEESLTLLYNKLIKSLLFAKLIEQTINLFLTFNVSVTVWIWEMHLANGQCA